MGLKHVDYRPLAAALLMVCLFPHHASAYLDYGSGSYIFQIIIGFILTAALSMRMAWGRILAFFKSLFQPRRDGPENPG